MVEEMIFNAPDKMKAGIFEFLLHKSIISSFKLLNGLSIIATFIYEFIFKYLKAVTAPIDLPHKPIYFIFSIVLKYLYTSSTSFHSWYPSEIYSPSAFPQPVKSKVQRDILFFINYPKSSILWIRYGVPFRSIATVAV